MADDNGTPTPTPGGNYVENGGKECLDESYFISVCESGFVDPTLRRTIVEASATLNDCEVCVTCAEVRAAVDAINELLDNVPKVLESQYSATAISDQSNPGSTEYEDVTNWGDSAFNSDFSLSGGTTLTANASGGCSMRVELGVQSSFGNSSCSVRIVGKKPAEDEFSIRGSEVTGGTSTGGPETIIVSASFEASDGEEFKVQYRNNESFATHTILTEEADWFASITAIDLGFFSGSTISDNVDLKTALQELEIAVELAAMPFAPLQPVAPQIDLLKMAKLVEKLTGEKLII